jgi:6-pyruvoyltetrahydropterin/6-carboxytetrahydropterin synthase
VISVTRRYWFPAAHVLRSRALSDAENVSLYGKCANPKGHGHNYGLEVSVAGERDPRTGWIVPPETFDAIVRTRVLERFDHRLLNEDLLFRDLVPSAENIAIVLYRELAPPLAMAGSGRLVRVGVIETPRNRFDYEETS